MKLTADAARNLFSWNSKCAATPFELSRLPAPYTQMVCDALFIANGDYQVQLRQNEQGEAESFWMTAPSEEEAIALQFERLTAEAGAEL